MNISEQLGTLIFGLSLLGMEWAGARELTISIRDVLALIQGH